MYILEVVLFSCLILGDKIVEELSKANGKWKNSTH